MSSNAAQRVTIQYEKNTLSTNESAVNVFFFKYVSIKV